MWIETIILKFIMHCNVKEDSSNSMLICEGCRRLLRVLKDTSVVKMVCYCETSKIRHYNSEDTLINELHWDLNRSLKTISMGLQRMFLRSSRLNQFQFDQLRGLLRNIKRVQKYLGSLFQVFTMPRLFYIENPTSREKQMYQTI